MSVNIFDAKTGKKLFKAAQAFSREANSNQHTESRHDKSFGKALKSTIGSNRGLSELGENLAKRYLYVNRFSGQEPKLEAYKNESSKNQLRKLLETAFAFFGKQERVVVSSERKSKIASAIFQIGEGFAKEVEKYRKGALDIFTRIKNRISAQKDAGSADVLEAFAMNPVKRASDTIYGKTNISPNTNTALAALENPLLDYGTEPQYSKIKPEHIIPALTEACARSKAQIDKILKLLEADPSEDNKNMTFENTLVALSEAEAIFEDAAQIFGHIESVNNTEDLRAIRKDAKKIISDFSSYLGNNDELTELKKRYLATAGAQLEKGPRAKYIKDLVLNLKLSGAELKANDKTIFNKLNEELSQLGSEFKDHVMDSRQDILFQANEQDQLAGLTKDDLENLNKNAENIRDKLIEQLVKNDSSGLFKDNREAAEQEAFRRIPEGSYLISGDHSIFLAVMMRLDSSVIRKRLYMLMQEIAGPNANRGLLDIYNGTKNAELDNTEISNRIFAIRQEKAKLLGYNNHAQVSTATKMAASPERVIKFHQEIFDAVKPLAQKDYSELLAFQQEINYQNSENNSNEVYPWDIDYLDEKIKKSDYGIDDSDIKPYFEYKQTLKGMLACAAKLFNIRFIEKPEADALAQNIGGVVYEVIDNKTGKKLGNFLVDPFARANTKNPGARAITIRSGYTKQDGSKVLPMVNLVCNFNPPSENRPSLLTHDEVTTMFHEFGHGLHDLLSEAEIKDQSGTNTKWDFVELPSQLMENFAFDKDILQSFARNQSGEIIPDDLIEKMNAAAKFRAGSDTYRQISLGMADMALYNQSNKSAAKTPIEIFTEVFDRNRIGPKVKEQMTLSNRFHHIFSGGYSAGYYSYLWSKVLDAIAYNEFTKGGGSTLKPEVGQRYRKTILAVGSSEEEAKSFENFTGTRELDIKPLLGRIGALAA